MITGTLIAESLRLGAELGGVRLVTTKISHAAAGGGGRAEGHTVRQESHAAALAAGPIPHAGAAGDVQHLAGPRLGPPVR